MNIDEIIDAILNGVESLVVVNGSPLEGTDDFGTNMNAPFIVVGPPEMTWDQDTYCSGPPKEVTFPVLVVVDQNVFTTRDSPKLAITVAQAIQQTLRDANIGVLRPVAFTGGGVGGDRPAYEIPVSMILTE